MKNIKKATLTITSAIELSVSASAAQKAETIECKFAEKTKSTEPASDLGTIIVRLHDCQSNPLASERKYLRKNDGKVAGSLELYCTIAEPSMNLIEVKMYEDVGSKVALAVVSDIPHETKRMRVFGRSSKHAASCKVQ